KFHWSKSAKQVKILLMYEWYERVGTGIDITNLHQQYPEVNWRRFKDWVKSQNWDDIRQQ
ncbi:MAG: hypothetical protein WAZ77_11430, partial [Candidatus Nitrosopolaris sp.]